MARTPEREEGVRDKTIRARVTEEEIEIIDGAIVVAAGKDVDRSDGIRTLAELVPLLAAHLRGTLAPVRGKLAPNELSAMLDVMNGCHMLTGHPADPDSAGFLGSMLIPNLSDTPGLQEKWDVKPDKLIGKLAKLDRATMSALEVWCGWLWIRYQDDALWEREIEWLSRKPR